MLNQDFKEFIKSLNDNGVRYLVVGGYAVALHGYPRDTKDMDIWVEMTAENASKISRKTKGLQAGIKTLLIWKIWNNALLPIKTCAL